MARGRVFTAPKAFIKIDNEVAGYVRNLTFSENVQRANVQGLGSLTYQEAPPVVYTCQWSVSQYFISFNTPIMKKMLKKFGSIAEIKNSLVLGDIAFDITVYAKTVSSEDAATKLVTEVDNTFQFHNGTINTPFTVNSLNSRTSFNSTTVQLIQRARKNRKISFTVSIPQRYN